MPKIATASSVPELRVNLNITVNGSKKLSQEAKEGLPLPASVRVWIVDAADADNVLVNEERPFSEFTSGNVGYKLQMSAGFHKEDESG